MTDAPDEQPRPIDVADALLADVEACVDAERLRDAQGTALAAIRYSDNASVSLRYRLVLALVQRQLGNFAEARTALGDVVARARPNDAELSARAGTDLAGVLIVTGEFKAAQKAVDEVLPSISAALYPRLLVQQAYLHQMRGGIDLALETFADALEAASAIGDQVAVVYVLNNRGILFAQQDRYTAAEVDFRRALLVAPPLGPLTASIEHNLGQLLGRCGQIRESLVRVHRADSLLASDPRHGVLRWIAEAEILFGARLLGDAATAARAAVAAAERQGTAPQHPEALVLLGRIALARGNLVEARARFEEAADHFGMQDRPSSYLAARRVLQVLGSPDLDGIVIDADSAELLEALMAVGVNDERRSDALLAAADAVSSPVGTSRLLGYGAKAIAARRGGDVAGARSSLIQAAATLENVVSEIGSLELRASAAHMFAPFEAVGIQLALDTGEAQDFLNAALGTRSVVLGGARAVAEAGLSTELAALRDSDPDVGAGLDDGYELDAIEERITALARLQPEHGVSQPMEPPMIDGLLNKQAHLTIAFSVVGDRVIRMVVGVEAAVTDIGHVEAVADALRQLRFAASQMARSHVVSDPGRLHSALNADAIVLDALLLDGLHETPESVTIVSGRMLTGVPWRLLPTLSAIPVALNIAGTLTLPSEASKAARSVTIVVGPGLEAEVPAEVSAICDHYPSAKVLTGPKATVGATLRALASDDIVHIAAHGLVHVDDPLFSSIELANGPLTSHHIETIPSVCSTVVLAACGLGTGPVGQPIDFELATVLASRGAREVVLANVDLSDSQSAVVMPKLHEGLAAGTPARLVLPTLQFDDPVARAAAQSLLPAEADNVGI